MIDTHTHLNFKAFADDWKNVVGRAIETGVEKMIVVGTNLETSKRAVEMADKHPALYAAVGIHPYHANAFLNDETKIDATLKQLQSLTTSKRVVAIGEIGLDRHEYKQSQYQLTHSTEETERLYIIQKRLFADQVKLALRFHKPVVVHSREVKENVLEIMQQISDEGGNRIDGVFHCFEGSKKYVKRILQSGYSISFTGNITFIPDRLNVAALVPLDRLLIETDCPYITPEPKRGERNEPANVKLVAEAQARGHKVSVREVERRTSENAERLFRFSEWE